MKTFFLIILSPACLFASCDMSGAINSLRPGSEWALHGNDYSGLEWLDKSQGKPSKKEVSDALDACRTKETQDKAEKSQAKLDLNTKSKTDAQRIDAIIKFLDLDK